MAYSLDRLLQQGADDGHAVLVIPPSMLQLLCKSIRSLFDRNSVKRHRANEEGSPLKSKVIV